MNAHTGFASLPELRNEPVRSYAPGTPERAALHEAIRTMRAARIELPLFIGGMEVRTGRLEAAVAPHDHALVLADAHLAGRNEVKNAIAAARRAWHDWSRTAWSERAAIFLKAAELLAGPWRMRLNAATMLGQSKTAHQAEIDSAAELIDFLRFNVSFAERLYAQQPISPAGIWNRIDYRPLEGFVFAVTPFNFTAIAGNLPCAPALLGNTVLWKPSTTAKLSAHYIMQLLREAGLPDGVINLVYGEASVVADVALSDAALAGLHFTGSTQVFNDIQKRLAAASYRNYPRVVGETGGKNFVLAHASADLGALATAIVRGGYEYQGQKCSAASRIFVPRSLWPALRELLVAEIATIRVGDVADFSNFMGAVIDARAWRRHKAVLDAARAGEGGATLICGGEASIEPGYFVAPTLLELTDPRGRYMTEEFFGPIVSVFVYEDARFADVVSLIDESSAYGLTGAVFAADRAAIAVASDGLRHAAGNFYINDKPTGAVVGQQPFGGARASGTNDKAGSLWNLSRWVSPRTIKETFDPPRDYRYPFMRPG
jgi:1-pyrroline-5-carboxylate dehydrogenase